MYPQSAKTNFSMWLYFTAEVTVCHLSFGLVIIIIIIISFFWFTKIGQMLSRSNAKSLGNIGALVIFSGNIQTLGLNISPFFN